MARAAPKPSRLRFIEKELSLVILHLSDYEKRQVKEQLMAVREDIRKIDERLSEIEENRNKRSKGKKNGK